MDLPFLVVVVVVATAAVVGAGIYLTLRGFKASEARANGSGSDVHTTPDVTHAVSRHDPATIERLKRFFDGKACAICKRPIPPVPRTGLKPGLLNPTTHETHSWDRIPDHNLAQALEQELPMCPACVVAESFRQRFPDHVVDRERSLEGTPSRSVI